MAPSIVATLPLVNNLCVYLRNRFIKFMHHLFVITEANTPVPRCAKRYLMLWKCPEGKYFVCFWEMHVDNQAFPELFVNWVDVVPAGEPDQMHASFWLLLSKYNCLKSVWSFSEAGNWSYRQTCTYGRDNAALIYIYIFLLIWLSFSI